MLGFTHQSRGTGNRWIDKEPDFQPIIITNKLPKEVSPKKEHKLIGKATQARKNPRTTSKQFTKPSKPKQHPTQKQWTTGGAVRGAFDKNLVKNELAAQERRLRAQIKKQKQLNHQQIIINEKKIGTKAVKMMQQKDEEIEYLKQMIEREKQQKAKIDRMYEQKKEEIERERLELIELERKIQKEGIKEKKVVRQIQRLNSPENDLRTVGRSRGGNISSQQVPSRQIDRQQMKRSYEQPTQSEALHQKNTLRQKQLDFLINQRQKVTKGLPNINYSPTLIPLLSKASYKIVSTHVSQIVQLLVDQLLQEQVYLLEQIELEQAKERQEHKSKQALNEYCQMVFGFVEQNDEIANKVGKYSTMNFADVYKPKHYPQKEKGSAFSYDTPTSPIFRQINLQAEFDQDRTQEVENRKDRFIRFVSNFDEYKKPNIDMFTKCAEEIIDEAIEKLARELDKGSGEFVDVVFRNQFK